MDDLLLDIRYGLRTLWQSGGLTAIVSITIALGVGVNTATFSLINGFLLRPLPLPAPQQLTVLAVEEKGSPLGALGLSYPAFTTFRRQSRASCDVFGQVLAGSLGLSTGSRTEQLSVSVVTSNFFSGLGVTPAVGRLIVPVEGENPGEDFVLVLGYSYWQKRFGSDPNVIGRQVRLDGKLVTIIGVVAKEFHGTLSPFEIDGYVPLSTLFPSASIFWTDRNQHRILAMGRLRPGVSLSRAQGAFDLISKQLAEEYTATDKGFSLRVLPERSSRPVPYANNTLVIISLLFLFLAALVLLLACTNVANILMARSASRLRETAIRTALGASRVRLVRQMLTETMLLAFLGGGGGVLLGVWASRLTTAVHLPNFPLQLDSHFDWRVFGYALVTVVLTGLLAGVSPAFAASKGDLNVLIHEGGERGNVARHRLRTDLMIVQVAGSLTLLIVAGLFVRSLGRAGRMDLGFDPEHLLNVTLDPEQNNYTESQTKQFYRGLYSQLRSLPGIQSFSLASSVPISSFPGRQSVYVEGKHYSTDQRAPQILFNRINPDYFETMRIPLLVGREFSDSDNEEASSVAIINQTMASQLWPHQEPIGRRFSTVSESGPFTEVVGIARDSTYQTIAENPQPYVYLPIAQNYTSSLILQVRSSLPLENVTGLIQEQIRKLDPTMPIVDTRTMKDSLEGGTGFFIFRLGASLAGLIGVLGLILAVIGVYGVVSYAATHRRREIGIRMALGANQWQIVRLILNQGAKVVLAGVVAGLLLAWLLTRLMAHLLIGIGPSDPATYIAVVLLLSSISLLACCIPAWRAMKVDPMVALRSE
jgi:macrolide transport system ATP-binding/permease protein